MKQGHARILDESFVPDPDELLEAVRLAQRPSSDPEARAFVTLGMARLVYRLSESYMRKWISHLPSHASFDDVFGDGLAGLHDAVNRFDHERGYVFTTYAAWYIRSGVQRAIYDLAGGGSIRAKALIKGVAPDDTLVGSAMLSLDRRLEDGDDEYAGLPSYDPDTSLAVEVLDLLTAVDPHLPLIADLLDRGAAMRVIAREVGLPVARVRELIDTARVELEVGGYRQRSR